MLVRGLAPSSSLFLRELLRGTIWQAIHDSRTHRTFLRRASGPWHRLAVKDALAIQQSVQGFQQLGAVVRFDPGTLAGRAVTVLTVQLLPSARYLFSYDFKLFGFEVGLTLGLNCPVYGLTGRLRLRFWLFYFYELAAAFD